MTMEKAADLAKATAQTLGRVYVVVKGHIADDEYEAYSRAYVENRMYCGDIVHGQVICAYSPDGQEIDRELISDTTRY